MQTIKLSRIAQWNTGLVNGYRTWFTQVDDRKYRIYAESLNGIWHIEEVDYDGSWTGGYLNIALTLKDAKRSLASL